MDRRLVDGSKARFAAYIEELASVNGCRPGAPLEAHCIGLLLLLNSKRGADGGCDGASTGFGAASIAVACQQPTRTSTTRRISFVGRCARRFAGNVPAPDPARRGSEDEAGCMGVAVPLVGTTANRNVPARGLLPNRQHKYLARD